MTADLIARAGGTQTHEYRRADLPPTLEAALALPEVQALVEAAERLNDIIEGIQGAMDHGTFWSARSNTRLKDTNEWVRFYNARAALRKVEGKQ